MLTPAFLTTLHCPYCGLALSLDTGLSGQGEALDWATVRCACYRYPIVDGILILRQHSPAFSTVDQIVARLDANDRIGALTYALSATSPVPPPLPLFRRALNRLIGQTLGVEVRSRAPGIYRQVVENDSLNFYDALRILRPASYADYLYYRYANTSLLASVPLMSVLETVDSGTILDLACGIGHSSFLIKLLFPHLDVIAIDHDLVNLYLARRFVAPHVTYISVDTEYPLPFADESLAGVWCLDALHYVRSKVALAGEVKRVTTPGGVWLLPHLHNALVENVSPGIPLSPDDYRRCFESLNPRLFVESDVLRDFTAGSPLDLSVLPADEALRAAQVVDLVGADAPDVWKQYDGLVECMIETGNLRINPIYRVQEVGSSLRLQIAWPSPFFQAECGAVTAFIPSECEIERALLDRLRDRHLDATDAGRVEALVRSFVLVPLPAGYPT